MKGLVKRKSDSSGEWCDRFLIMDHADNGCRGAIKLCHTTDDFQPIENQIEDSILLRDIERACVVINDLMMVIELKYGKIITLKGRNINQWVQTIEQQAFAANLEYEQVLNNDFMNMIHLEGILSMKSIGNNQNQVR